MVEVAVETWEKWSTELAELEKAEPRQCESPNHLVQTKVHKGHATHYAMLMHFCEGRKPSKPGDVYAICERFALELRRMELDGKAIRCTDCNRKFLVTSEWVRLVGPIND